MALNYAEFADAVNAALKRVYPYVRKTPLHVHAQKSSTTVYLKLESEQVTGSFKARGAVNKILSLADEDLQRGIVTASTGNHGRGVAHALSVLPRCAKITNSRIFVPSSVAPIKLSALRALGAPVVVCESGDCVAAENEARLVAERDGATFVSPYADTDVAAGQGTAGAELLQQVSLARQMQRARQLAAIDGTTTDFVSVRRPLVVIVPVGGGGLIAGIAAALKLGPGAAASISACAGTKHSDCYCDLVPRAEEIVVIGSQPATNACMAESVAAGRILDEGEYTDGATLSDGTAGGIERGAFTFLACARASLKLEGAHDAVEAARAACASAGGADAVESSPTDPSVRLVDAILTVPEDAIAAAMMDVLNAHHKVIEGAAGTAVAIANAHSLEGGVLAGCDVVAVCCGGNVSTEKLAQVMLAV